MKTSNVAMEKISYFADNMVLKAVKEFNMMLLS